MAWTIKYADTAVRQLKKLDKPVARRILDYMDEKVATAEDPHSLGKALTGPMGGLWRFRVGDYRVVCEIHNGQLVVLVLEIGNRKEVYRK